MNEHFTHSLLNDGRVVGGGCCGNCSVVCSIGCLHILVVVL